MQGYDRPGSSEISPDDPDGLDTLLAQCDRHVRRAAARYGIGAAAMDELVQDVRLRLWRATKRAGGWPRSPAAFVHRAAVSAAVDMVRRRRSEGARLGMPLDDLSIPDRTGSAALDEERLIAVLATALERVSPARRPAVQLHLMGRGLDEIALAMASSPGRARNLLYRGLEELREQLLDARARPAVPRTNGPAARRTISRSSRADPRRRR